MVEKLQGELAELQRLYNQLQFGGGSVKQDYALPFSQVPDLGVQLASLAAEVKIQETVYGLLNQQYYQAKIDEARDTPTVQVLDRAVAPAFRSAPKRKMLLLVFGLLSLVLSILYVIFASYWKVLMGQPDKRQKIDRLAEEWRKETHWLRRRS